MTTVNLMKNILAGALGGGEWMAGCAWIDGRRQVRWFSGPVCRSANSQRRRGFGEKRRRVWSRSRHCGRRAFYFIRLDRFACAACTLSCVCFGAKQSPPPPRNRHHHFAPQLFYSGRNFVQTNFSQSSILKNDSSSRLKFIFADFLVLIF
jgi:hypothetical protein